MKHEIVPLEDIDSECDIESQTKKNYDWEDDPCQKRLKKVHACIIILFIIVSIFSILKIIFKVSILQNDTTMLLTDDRPDNGPDIAASSHSRGYYYRIHNKQGSTSPYCWDYKYGCCEIFDDCQVSDGTITYNDNFNFYENFTHSLRLNTKSISIDPRKIHKHDENGSNCPRVSEMIQYYTVAYGDKDCLSSRYGCCTMYHTCDTINGCQTYQDESRDQLALIYHSNRNSNKFNMSTGIFKRDEEGTNCPGPRDLVFKYESGFRTETESLIDIFTPLIIMWVIIWILHIIC